MKPEKKNPKFDNVIADMLASLKNPSSRLELKGGNSYATAKEQIGRKSACKVVR